MAKAQIIYDDSQLQKMWRAMSYKERTKSMKQAMRKTGNDFKKAYIADVRSKGAAFRGTKWQRICRVLVFKQKIGFRFTLAPK